MSQPPDRDAALDRLLHALPAEDAGPTADCFDAEAAAAYVDGGLPEAEHRIYMTHAATCDHCQALLAALLRSEAPAAAARAWWQLQPWPWLVPALGAVTGLLLWVAVDRQPAVTVIKAPVPVAAPDALAMTARSDARTEMDPLARKALELQARTPTRPDQGAATRTGGAPPPPMADRELADTRTLASGAKVRSAEGPTVVAAEQLARGDAASPAAPAPGPPGDTPRPLSQAFVDRAAKPAAAGGTQAPGVPVTSQTESVSADAAARSGAAGNLRRIATTPAAIEVRSSDPRIHWRIAGNAVERSADGGVSWTPQAVGVSSRLTGGSAPLPEVCWIVGDGGVIVMTADGISWNRVAFPEPAALASVSATSADAATVTTSDGRVFTTTDRGKTWR